MAFKNYPEDPTLYKMRNGTSDPFLKIDQTDQVRNQIILLHEVPDKFQGITISDGSKNYSVKDSGLPDPSTIVIDWIQGKLTTHSSLEGKTLTCSYYGKGNVYFPSSKVYVDTDKTTGEVKETLKNLTDDMMENRDIAAETNRVVQAAEAIRVSQENQREQNEVKREENTTAAIDRMDDVVDRTKFIEQYNPATVYKPNNIISFNGHSFMARKETVGNPPPSDVTISTENEYWSLVARKGADGTGTVHVHRDRFVATEGQTIFTLSHTYDQFQNRTNVTVGGVPQKTPDNYEEATSNTIAFYDGLPEGTIVEVKYFSEAQPLQTDIETVVDNHTEEINKFNNQSLHTETFTATAGQSVFTLKSRYDQLLGKIEVYVDGVPQDSGENFTESANNTITLSEGVPAGTEVKVRYVGRRLPIVTDVETALNNHASELAQKSKDLEDRAINVKLPPFNATGNGVTDDTVAIQSAINLANSSGGRKVFIPKGDYLISSPIVLNGCSLEGVQGNIFNNSSKGTCLVAATNDFIVVKQGSTSSADIQFNVKNIYVRNAKIGFEFNYVINSIFEQLYAENCDIGFKLGESSVIGSMFCEFNNLYTRNTRIGILSQSKDFFNNNQFNNGFITGTEKAVHLEVTGGYGAVNNVFNNVEFRSPLGRGLVLKNAQNTTINNPYFECGGNAIRTIDYCPIILNDPIFGLFKANNSNMDTSFIYAEGGFRMKIDGGVIFLTSENNNTSLYNATDSSTHANIYVLYNPRNVGSATNFKRFLQPVNEVGYTKEEQVLTTSTVTVAPTSYETIDFTFPTPFSKTPDVVTLTMRGASNTAPQMSHVLVSKSATGGQISVYNASTGGKSVNFNVYAKVL